MGKVERQVETGKYNKEYYKSLYKEHDYSKKFDWDDFGDIYKELSNLIEVSADNKVIDFGCGNGELSFCLYEKYGCNVIGLDYSKDAVDIANENVQKMKKGDSEVKISFFHYTNDNLPEFKNVKQVYFCDVLEHMYNDEISIVLEKVKDWNKNGNIKIIVHTDNDLYLRFVRPLFDTFSVLFGFSNAGDISKRNNWERERHVNLTNPSKLRKKLAKLGYKQITLKYPVISREKIGKQLVNAQKVPFLIELIYVFLSAFKFLSPSFHAIYEYKKDTN